MAPNMKSKFDARFELINFIEIFHKALAMLSNKCTILEKKLN
jgi:hypothetical protein